MQKLRVIDGKYVVKGTLGSGGMGVVLEAEHTGLGRIVAIKVLHPHLAGDEVQTKRFTREARTAGMTGHPNVCTVFDAGTLEDGRPYLVMERLYGQSLATRLADGRAIAPETAVAIAIQVLSAMSAVHRAGVVHRDIKPDNVFLANSPDRPSDVVVKVLDFGTSKPMSGAEHDLTGTGIAIGTAYYMSPEQARGERDLDGRVDVYACGVMLYEMLSGHRPFSGGSEHGVLLKILAGGTTPLRNLAPHVSAELEAVVAMAMAKDRDLRFQTTDELREALEALAEGRVSADGRERPQPPAAPLPDSVRADLRDPRGRADDAVGRSPPSEPTTPVSGGMLKPTTDTAVDAAREPSPHTAPTRFLTPLDDVEEATRILPPRGS